MVTIEKCPVCGATQFSNFLAVQDYFLTKEPFQLQQCSSCSFVFTNPRPGEDALPRYYDSPDYLSHHSQGFNLVNFVYQSLRRINIHNKYSLIRRYVPQGTLLDVGCGTGELLSYFQQRKWRVKGIEPNTQAREFAIKHHDLDILDESGLETIPPNSFDVISLWHVLEHVPDPQQRIKALSGLLKPFGYLVIALPNLNSWDAQYYGQHWAAYDVPRHLHHFTKKTISYLVEKCQFRLIASYPMKMDAYFVSMLSEKYRHQRNRYFSAAIQGFRSNTSARNTGEFSSLIYVFKSKR